MISTYTRDRITAEISEFQGKNLGWVLPTISILSYNSLLDAIPLVIHDLGHDVLRKMSIDPLRYALGIFRGIFSQVDTVFLVLAKQSFHLSYEERAVAAFFPAVNALRRTSGSTWDDAEISSEDFQGKRKPIGMVVTGGGGARQAAPGPGSWALITYVDNQVIEYDSTQAIPATLFWTLEVSHPAPSIHFYLSPVIQSGKLFH